MKRKNIYAKVALSGVLALSLVMTSCEDFLTVYPTNQIPEEQFFQDKNDLDNVKAAAYLQMTNVTNKILIWGEARSDNFSLRDVNESYERLKNGVLQPTEDMFDWAPFYTGINYCNKVLEEGQRMIDENVDPSFRDGDWQPIKAEMTALRALYYFYLVRAYRDVPYVTYSISTDAQAMREGRTRAVAGAVILGDLIQQLEDVKDVAATNFGSTADNKGYFTKLSVRALLADMYLWRGCLLRNYQEKGGLDVNLTDIISEDSTTVTTADGVLVDKAYTDNLSAECFQMAAERAQDVITSLKADYDQNLENSFGTSQLEREQPYPLIRIPTYGTSSVTDVVYSSIWGNKNSSESILELQYDGTNLVNTTVNSFLSNYANGALNAGTFTANSNLINSANSVNPTKGFGQTDIRLLESVQFQSMSQSSFFIMKNTATSLSIADLEDMTEGYSGTPNYRTSASSNANWPVYRLTDVMLIKAEALARSNADLQEGFRLVNEIFARSNPALGSSNSTESDYVDNADLQCDRLNDNYYSGKSANDLLTLLYNERQLEFFAEGKRWFDLVRQAEADNSTETALEWMAASTSLQNRLRSLYSMYNPIYYSELDANGVENGGYLRQNPVWERYSN